MYTVFLMHGAHKTGYLQSDYLTEKPFWVLCIFFKVALNKNSFHLLLNACYRSYCKYFILVSFISFLACSCISIWSNRHVCVSLFRNSSFRSASKWMVKLVTWVVAWSPSKGARAKSQWHQRSPSLKGKSEIRDSFSWSWMLMKGW